MATLPFTERFSRIPCLLVGCASAREYPACTRCGADIYDPAFVQEPCRIVLSYRNAFGWLRWKLTIRRCQECHKRLFGNGDPDGFCSMKCFDAWIPF
jgi:hypothetical protein